MSESPPHQNRRTSRGDAFHRWATALSREPCVRGNHGLPVSSTCLSHGHNLKSGFMPQAPFFLGACPGPWSPEASGLRLNNGLDGRNAALRPEGFVALSGPLYIVQGVPGPKDVPNERCSPSASWGGPRRPWAWGPVAPTSVSVALWPLPVCMSLLSLTRTLSLDLGPTG